MRRVKAPIVLALEIRECLSRRGIEGSTAIARAANLGQPQVHRNLYGRPKRVTKTLIALCKYACVERHEEASDPSQSQVLMQALANVWDGTDGHARLLAKLLLAHRQAHM